MKKSSNDKHKNLFDKNGRLTEKAVEDAKNVSIKELMESSGNVLNKEGHNYYSLADHDSFKIHAKDNKWYWNSRGRGGVGAITLLRDEELFNRNFRDAVIELNTEEAQRLQGDFGKNALNKEPREPYQFPTDTMISNTDKVKQYLVEERKLNENIVNTLINKGLIRQDQRNNVVYPWAKDSEIVGHNLEGTYKSEEKNRFKQVNSLGDNAEGFSFQTGQGEVKNHFYFESEVDAMSYVSLNGLTDHSKYIAMRGVNNEERLIKELVDHVKKYDRTPNIVYAVDNDTAGENFLEREVSNARRDDFKGTKINYFVATPPKVEGVKDWNDLLQVQNGKPFEPEERTKIWSKQAYTQLQQNKTIEKEI